MDRQGSGTADSVRVSADQVRVAGVGRPLRDAPIGHHKILYLVACKLVLTSEGSFWRVLVAVDFQRADLTEAW